MKILAIGSHPDDIEFGCGGTLIKYGLKGHDIYLLVMTEGRMGGDPVERRKEQEEAAQLLGARELFWGGYEDTEISNDRDLIAKIEGILQRIKPDLIFVHCGDDTHQDHRHLTTSVASASRYTRNVLLYEGPTTANFTPSVFVDINAVLERKLQALKAHASQIGKTGVEELSVLNLAQAAAHFRGVQGRVRNAEGFMPLRLFINVD